MAFGTMVIVFSVWSWIGAVLWSVYHIVTGSFSPIAAAVGRSLRRHPGSNQVKPEASTEADCPGDAIARDAEYER